MRKYWRARKHYLATQANVPRLNPSKTGW